MELLSSFSNLYSHPDKPLEIHLINVADIVVKNLESLPIKPIGSLNKDKLTRLAKLCAFCHDVGKATEYFQRYLFTEGEEQSSLKLKEETHHSLLSSIVALCLTIEEFKDDVELSEEEKQFVSFIAFLSVKRHHGDLRDVLEEAILEDKEINILLKQIQSIDETKFSIFIENLKRAGFKYDLNKEILELYVYRSKEILKNIRRNLRRLKENNSIDLYILNNILFSLIIDADKSEVGIRKIFNRREMDIPYVIIDNYKTSLKVDRNDKVNILREKAYKEVMSKNIELDQKIYSINLPTGLGKTFTSLAFALKLREMIYRERGYKPRIIYTLPFLSIIDQNASVIDSLLQFNNIPLDTDIFLKHHHLSDLYYKTDDNEFEAEEAKLLIESWNSEIIITTFVQFFHSLISNRNRMLRKLHRLSGSIVILDEIQAIPFKYWNLLEKLFEYLTSKFELYIIFSTATQPFIIPKGKIHSLVNPEEYFYYMDRVILEVLTEQKMTLEELISNFTPQKDKSYLFIMNTISSSEIFYKLLKDKTSEEIVYLSTHITPNDRLKRIKKISDRKVRMAVTTQLVEAGVDIDFDVVFRDMAPLDSVIQAIGRCNRNWRKGQKGICNLVELKDDRRTYASYIYDYLLLNITQNILSKKRTIMEKDFLDIINLYYEDVNKKKSDDKSREFIDAIYSLKYTSDDGSTSIENFKLIEEEYMKIDIFIEQDEEAEMLWKRYCDIREIKDLFERRVEFNRIKSRFYRYVISIPIHKVKNLPPIVNGLGYVSRSSLKDYYDEETGFKCKGELLIW